MANYKPKLCARCGTEFTPNSARSKYCTPEHYEDAHRKQALDHYYENRRKDPAAIRKRDRAYRQANREKIQRQARAYYDNNKARILEYSRAYSREWRTANPERAREQRRRWRANNPDKVGKATARRAQVELEGNATRELIQAKWEASSGTCCPCGESINPDLKSPDPMSLTVEHKVPIARGGRHDIDNIDFAHRVCNSSKGARTTEEYMERRKLAS